MKHPYKIGIYSPYLNIYGGGERYIFSIAKELSKKNNVYLFGSKKELKLSEKVFGITLNNINLLPRNDFQDNFINRLRLLKSFDKFIYMTDGSLFLSPAKKNYLIVQSPSHIPHNSLFNKIKLINWSILSYSKFMKKIIDEKINVESMVLAPPIDTESFSIDSWSKKNNIILTVGRFFLYPHNKKQDFLLDVFIKNYRHEFKGWKMIIAGGASEKESEVLISNLRKKSEGFPINIVVNPNFSELVKLYQISKIYWHATGYNEDLSTFPERAEHFGITTLEAMSARCVPLVINEGGQPELVYNNKNGFLWSSEEELVKKTKHLINNPSELSIMSQQARIRASEFSNKIFSKNLEKII